MPRPNKKLKVGSPAPAVRLRAINGAEVCLWDCLMEGPVLIEFIRGTWCPNARKRLVELAEERGRFRSLWTRILVIVCEDPFTVERYFEGPPSPLTVLMDTDRRTARDYGVHVRFGLDGWNIARPSSFLLDRAGYVRFLFVASIQTETCPVETLLEEINKFERREELNS
jgi:peroxiredoxin